MCLTCLIANAFPADLSSNATGNATCASCENFENFNESDYILYNMTVNQIAPVNSPCTSCDTPAQISEGDSAPGSNSQGEITIGKTAPREIVKGDTVEVKITISNGLTQATQVRLRETIGHVDIIDQGVFKRTIASGITSAPPYYEAVVNLRANSSTTISYKIKPLYYGEYMIPPTDTYASSGVIQSNDLSVNVKCNENHICEPDLDENALTCPHDCQPDKKDALCNPAKDGVCDPDCKLGEDPDCNPTTTTARSSTTTTVTESTNAPSPCGNGVCEQPAENYATCPSDCQSGLKDGYCDKVKDGRCDPDCKNGEDPDCNSAGTGAYVIIFAVIIAAIIFIAYKRQWLRPGKN